MRMQFVQRTDGPDRLVVEAELVFDEPGPLSGMKLVGFALWRDPVGDLYVTFPSRAFGAGPERRYFDYLRSADGDAASVKNVKSWILAEHLRSTSVETSAPAPSPRSSRRRNSAEEPRQ
jgi:hypothetical protein